MQDDGQTDQAHRPKTQENHESPKAQTLLQRVRNIHRVFRRGPKAQEENHAAKWKESRWSLVPIVFDPVEDRIRSRLIPALTVSLLVVTCAAVFMDPSWGETLSQRSSDSTHMEILFLSSDSLIFTQVPNKEFAPQVRLINDAGWPFSDKRISANITGQRLNALQSANFSVCTSNFQQDSIPTVRYAEICQVSMIGAESITDLDGVATFHDLVFARGLPGAYELTLTAADTEAPPLSFWVSVSSAIVQLSQESVTPNQNPGTQLESMFLRPSLTVDPNLVPIIKVHTIQGYNVANHVVSVVALNSLNEVGSSLPSGALTGQPEADEAVKNVILGSAVAVTDEFGVASFDSLQVLAYNAPAVLLMFTCEGVSFVYGETELPNTVFVPFQLIPPPFNPVSDPLRLVLHEEPRTEVLEGELVPLQHQLLGANILPVTAGRFQGRRCIAFAEPIVDTATPMRVFEQRVAFKTLLGAISDPIGEDGTLHFPNLRFSSEGQPGRYRVRAVFDGIVDAQTRPIIVQTRVSEVRATFDTTTTVNCSFAAAERCGWLRLLRPQQYPTLVAHVFDERGEPLVGKHLDVVVIIVVNGTRDTRTDTTAVTFQSQASTSNGLTFLTGLTILMQNVFRVAPPSDPPEPPNPLELILSVDGVVSRTFPVFDSADLRVPEILFPKCQSSVCGTIEIVTAPPLEWQPGAPVDPAPRARAIDIGGRTMTGVMCFELGRFDGSELFRQCLQTSRSGIATFSDLRLPSSGSLRLQPGGRSLWRFVLHNSASEASTKCWQANALWLESCSSAVYSMQVAASALSRIELGIPFTVLNSSHHLFVPSPRGATNGTTTAILDSPFGFRVNCFGTMSQLHFDYCSQLQPIDITWTPVSPGPQNTTLLLLGSQFRFGYVDNFEFLYNFEVLNSVPGTMRFRMNSYGVRTPWINVNVQSPATTLEVLGGPVLRAMDHIAVGQHFPVPITVLVTDELTRLIKDTSVGAEIVSESGSTSDAILGGKVVERSDVNGWATFNALTISVATPGVYRIILKVLNFGRVDHLVSVSTSLFQAAATLSASIVSGIVPFSASSELSSFTESIVLEARLKAADGSSVLFPAAWEGPRVKVSLLSMDEQTKGQIALDSLASGRLQRVDPLKATVSFPVLPLRVPAGLYALKFSGLTMESTMSTVFGLTSRPYRIEFLQLPPKQTVVGRPFQVSVRPLAATGISMAGQIVSVRSNDTTAIIRLSNFNVSSQTGNAAVSISGGDGLAVFDIQFDTAVTGNYHLVFMCQDAMSHPTPDFHVTNEVVAVEIDRVLDGLGETGSIDSGQWLDFRILGRPPATVNGAVHIASDIDETVKSLQMPILRALGSSSEPVINLEAVVNMSIFDEDGQELAMTFESVTEVSAGTYQIHGIRFEEHLASQMIHIEYRIAGVPVRQELVVYLRNMIVPDPVFTRQLRTGLLMSLVLVIPIFAANLVPRDDHCLNHFGLVFCLAACAVLTIVVFLWVDVTVRTYGGFTWCPPVQRAIITGLVAVMFSLDLTLFYSVVAFLRPSYHHWRLATFKGQMLGLLLGKRHPTIDAEGHAVRKRRNLKIEPINYEIDDGGANHKSALYDQPQGLGQSGPRESSDPASTIIDTGGGMKRLRHRATKVKQAAQARVSRLPSHAAQERAGIETEETCFRSILPWRFTLDFFFPARLLVGLLASAAGTIILLSFFWSYVKWVAIELQVQRSQLVTEIAQSRGPASAFEPPPVQTPGGTFVEPGYVTRYNHIEFISSIVQAWKVLGRGGFDDLVEGVDLANSLGLLAAIGTFCGTWMATLGHYRRTILLYRSNPDKFIECTKAYSVRHSGLYVGLQLWCSVCSCLLTYIPVTGAVMIISWKPTRDFVVATGALPLLAVGVLEVFLWVYRAWVRRTSIHGKFIVKRSRFSLYDTVALYLRLIGGVIIALARQIKSYADFVFAIGRLDMPVFGRKRAYMDIAHHAYMAALILDLRYNSPVPSVIVQTLTQHLLQRRRDRVKPAAEASEIEVQHVTQQQHKKDHAHHQLVRWRMMFSLWRSSILRGMRRFHRKPNLAQVIRAGATVSDEMAAEEQESLDIMQDWANSWVKSQSNWDTAERLSRRGHVPPYQAPKRLHVVDVEEEVAVEKDDQGDVTPRLADDNPKKQRGKDPLQGQTTPRLGATRPGVRLAPIVSSDAH